MHLVHAKAVYTVHAVPQDLKFYVIRGHKVHAKCILWVLAFKLLISSSALRLEVIVVCALVRLEVI